jgi:hypothetical protein
LFAIFAIEGSHEVVTAMNTHGIHRDSRPFSLFTAGPDENLPHLPEAISNVTMDQALDLVALTFGGIVEYGTCEKQPTYTVHFIGGRDFDVSDLPP